MIVIKLKLYVIPGRLKKKQLTSRQQPYFQKPLSLLFLYIDLKTGMTDRECNLPT